MKKIQKKILFMNGIIVIEKEGGLFMEKIVEALSCLKCGSNDLEYESGFLVCKFCHTKHILVNNSLVRVFEKQELFETADLYLEWGQYDVACKKYEEIVDKWAKETMAWWGIVRCRTENFTKIDITADYYESISEYADRAFKTSSPSVKSELELQWNKYTNDVFSLLNAKEQKRKEEAEQEELKKKAEKIRQDAYLAFMEKKAHEEKCVSRIITAVSVLVLIIINIAYLSLIISLNIPNSIYSSPACIGPVVVGGFVSMLIVGLSGGISRFYGLFWVPAAGNAVSVLMMISGMLSHSHGFFESLIVIVFFGAIGIGITALIGWLSWLITCGMNDNFDAVYFAHKYVEHKYK